MLRYNKLCELADFRDSELSAIIRDVFQYEIARLPPSHANGIPDSKQWECAMSLRALDSFGVLRPDSKILGVGAGTEITSFHLSNKVGQVFATDLYSCSGAWSDVAPRAMLVAPELFSPIEFRADHLVVQHMDARMLRFPDEMFDGIYSSGSIEHFGSLQFVANAAYEMGRVLKPGGVLAIATEYKVSGPPGGDGWDPNVLIMSQERIGQYIVNASGLEPVDSFEPNLSAETLSVRRDLGAFLAGTTGPFDSARKIAFYPNLVLYHEGYLFCSVAIVMQKSATYPRTDNSWAAPDATTRLAVQAARDQALSPDATWNVSDGLPTPLSSPGSQSNWMKRLGTKGQQIIDVIRRKRV
jgi:SAM-dependent methyltransferase